MSKLFMWFIDDPMVNFSQVSVVDQQKVVSLFFRQNESSCCVTDKPVSSRNNDMYF